MSNPAQYYQRVDVPEAELRVLDLTGAGASTPTKNSGPGAVVSRAGVGDYKFTFNENPGNFVCFGRPGLRSTTGVDLKNFDAVLKNYDTTNFVVEVFVFNGAGAATDLTSAQSLSIPVWFKRTKVS